MNGDICMDCMVVESERWVHVRSICGAIIDVMGIQLGQSGAVRYLVGLNPI